MTVRRHDNPMTTGVKLSLMVDVLDRLCIGLCMLRDGLIDAMDVVDLSGANFVRLTPAAHNTAIEFGRDKIVVALGPTDLERWLHFTLRSIRDGRAEVDHLDFEAKTVGHTDQLVDLIVTCPSHAPPLSSGEARRRLGL